MASKFIKRNGILFEIWHKSLRVCDGDLISPIFATYQVLNSAENINNEIDNFIKLMNIGIKIYKNKGI